MKCHYDLNTCNTRYILLSEWLILNDSSSNGECITVTTLAWMYTYDKAIIQSWLVYGHDSWVYNRYETEPISFLLADLASFIKQFLQTSNNDIIWFRTVRYLTTLNFLTRSIHKIRSQPLSTWSMSLRLSGRGPSICHLIHTESFWAVLIPLRQRVCHQFSPRSSSLSIEADRWYGMPRQVSSSSYITKLFHLVMSFSYVIRLCQRIIHSLWFISYGPYHMNHMKWNIVYALVPVLRSLNLTIGIQFRKHNLKI